MDNIKTTKAKLGQVREGLLQNLGASERSTSANRGREERGSSFSDSLSSSKSGCPSLMIEDDGTSEAEGSSSSGYDFSSSSNHHQSHHHNHSSNESDDEGDDECLERKLKFFFESIEQQATTIEIQDLEKLSRADSQNETLNNSTLNISTEVTDT